MAVCVVLSVDAASVPFGQAATETGVGRVALQRTVATGGSVLVWVEGCSGEFTHALTATDAVTDVDLFAVLDSGRLYRCEWRSEGLSAAVAAADGVLVAGAGTAQSWSFRLWFPDEQTASSFHEACQRTGLDPEIDRVRQVSDTEFRRYGLRGEQAALLATAFAEGYFEVPRGVTLEELAAEEGVSGQSLSARLRRALGTLVENTLVNGGRGGSAPPRCWPPEQ